ncbi:MAG: acetolactate synthase large subunit [Micromonosporaceae bacterium]
MQADVPTGGTGQAALEWGSDPVAEVLRRLAVPYVALTPGSSYRGLHDSLVNYLGNTRPQLIVCLHEEHAVAVAHGYAKVTGEPLAVAVHSNVGLMHATMAIYNAFCDRVPMLVVGATGPLDAAARRPWIDWIHTAADQAALVRPYVKWDDQPGSVQAAVDALVHANAVTRSYPRAPVYVCLDAGLQEARLTGPVSFPPLDRFAPTPPPAAPAALAEQIAILLARAQRPLILAGRVGRSPAAWCDRVALAERLGAAVLTDLKVAAAFPTDHPLHVAPPGVFLTPAGRQLVGRADLILSLDWVDLGGTLRDVFPDVAATPTVISCSVDQHLHNGWSKDHFRLPVSDLTVPYEPDSVVAALLSAPQLAAGTRRGWAAPAEAAATSGDGQPDGISMSMLARALRAAVGDRAVCLSRLPLGWHGEFWPFRHPLDYTGHEGGAGVGAGPGLAVGAALALAGSGRLCVAVMGDGDFLMGSAALWTAAHYRLPLLVVVANNRSFFNDEVHQQRVAVRRGRAVENRWVGQRIDDPAPDLAALARSYGLSGHGPVRGDAGLAAALRTAVDECGAGAAVVVDVHVNAAGYPGLAESATGSR